jgi:hypothetical protein
MVWGFGFEVWGFGFEVSGLGFRVSGLRFGMFIIYCLLFFVGLRVGFGVWDLEFGI